MGMGDGFHGLTALDASRNVFSFASLIGKVVLIVNVASRCGFTPQYEGLEALYRKYKDRGLVVIGFPCNQYGSAIPLPTSGTVKCIVGLGLRSLAPKTRLRVSAR